MPVTKSKQGKPLGGIGAERQSPRKHSLVIDDRLLSKQYITGRIEAKISDGALDASWDGDTITAPSKNAVYDYVSSLSATSDMWGAESGLTTSKTRARKSGNVGIGNANSMAFSDITHKLTIDGDLRLGKDISSSGTTSANMYIDDGASISKYSGSALLTFHSSNGAKFSTNLGIGSDNPSAPFEISAAGSNLTTADGTGLAQFGADSGANLGISANKIQARSGEAASALSINSGGGTLTLGATGSTTAVDGHLTVAGNLTVAGTATSTLSETVKVEDAFILLNSDYVGSSPTANVGIQVNRGGDAGSPDTFIRWNETSDEWQFTNDGSTYTNLGAGVGSGTITALNNQLENRLVTMGSTTTELDGEAKLLYDGTDLTHTSTGAFTLTGTSGASGTTALTVTGGLATSNSNAAVSIEGHLEATTKSFNIPHPLYVDKRLVYGSLEGPEHGMYQRGSFDIEDGRRLVAVDLPVYWYKMVYDDYSINLTTYGDYNVWISNRDENGFWVETNAEKEWSFDWSVIGGRKDAKLVVEPDA
jgi:hypothetical protein